MLDVVKVLWERCCTNKGVINVRDPPPGKPVVDWVWTIITITIQLCGHTIEKQSQEPPSYFSFMKPQVHKHWLMHHNYTILCLLLHYVHKTLFEWHALFVVTCITSFFSIFMSTDTRLHKDLKDFYLIKSTIRWMWRAGGVAAFLIIWYLCCLEWLHFFSQRLVLNNDVYSPLVVFIGCLTLCLDRIRPWKLYLK